MKRSFLYFAAGALALSACTSENVLEDVAKSRNVIGFENVVNKPSRIAGLDVSNLSTFYVWGYYTTPKENTVAVPVFQNVEVTKKPNGDWAYTGGDRYWVPDAHYYFYAYSCGNDAKLSTTFGDFSMDMSNGLAPDKRVLTIKDYRCDNTHQHDLIFASNTGAIEGNEYAGIVGKANGNDDVSLKFRHLLTKVKAQFTSSFPAGYTVQINNVRINNIHNIGTFSPEGGWDKVAHKAGEVSPMVYLLDTENKKHSTIETTVGGAAAVTDEAYVLPYEYEEPTDENGLDWVYIKFDITVLNKEQVVFEKKMTGHFNPTWLSGYSYTYNIELSGSAANLEVISFVTVTGEDWTTDTKNNAITIEK